MSIDVDAELRDKINAVYQDWIAQHGGSSAVLRDWIVIVGGVGFNAEGEDIERVMIVANGPYYSLLGLLAEVDTRFRAELVNDVLSGGSGDDG